jgi:predicted RNA-binding protein with PIN domain
MKRSGSGRREAATGRNQACLIVDGYNVIAKAAGAPLTRIEDLDEARQALVDALVEYAAFTGQDVIVVFDAHRMPGVGSEDRRAGVRVLFTMQNETADDRIERLVYDLADTYGRITVATSDAAEQQLTFGRGALRISADELLDGLARMREEVRRQIRDGRTPDRTELADAMTRDVANILEKWRRQ